MAKAKLIIDGIIGEPDPMLLAYGIEDKTISSSDVFNFLNENVDADVIEIEIRSNGGSVSQGFDIYDQLRNSGKKIITKGYRVNSIATVIFMAGDERYLSRNAEFVIHNPWIGAESLIGLMLTAEVLEGIADDVKQSEDKLFNFYAAKLGLNDSEKVKLRGMMDKDTDVGASEAIAFGFANGYLENLKQTVKRAAYTDYVLNKYNNLKSNNNSKMNTEVTEKLTGLEKLVNKVLNLLPKKQIMNAFINLDDGTPIYYEGDLAIGVPCFLDEEMTMPLADGTYPLADGKTLMVADGFVTEIHESGEMDKTAEIESLKNTITELQNKLSATETEKEKLNETNAAIATEVDALKVEINNFRKVVIGAERKYAEKKAEVVGEDAPQWKQVLHRVRSNRK